MQHVCTRDRRAKDTIKKNDRANPVQIMPAGMHPNHNVHNDVEALTTCIAVSQLDSSSQTCV